MLGNKLSFPLKPFTVEKGFSLNTLQTVFAESELPQWAYEVLMLLKPALLNRYKRKYHLSFDSDFRLTLDTELSYHLIGNNNNNFMQSHKSDDVIIELKYDFAKDKKANEITNNLPFRLTKSSKYVNGVDLLHPMLT